MQPRTSSLIAIFGPTGSGKSALAIALARSLGGEIVNFDSVQVYQRLDVGSAKTPFQDRQGVPHHLIDIIPPAGDLTAGAYATLARDCLQNLAGRRKLPVLVGGTGFYLRSLLDGLSPIPGRNPDLRQRLHQIVARRPAALHRFLRQSNPAAALRIHPNDHQKLIRAIEISTTAQPAPRQPLTGFEVVKIGLNPPRANLYTRINQRTLQMFESGLLAETRSLLDSGVPPAAKSLQSLGYKQAVAVLQNRLTEQAAISEIQTKTRQYAKRQLTWFRREADTNWLDGFGDDPAIQQNALQLFWSSNLSLGPSL